MMRLRVPCQKLIFMRLHKKKTRFESFQTLAQAAEDNEEEVDYAEITGDVVDKIDQSVQVFVPVVSVVVPRLPKALDFAKKRLGNFKVSGVSNII